MDINEEGVGDKGHTNWSQAVNNLFIQTNLGHSNYFAADTKGMNRIRGRVGQVWVGCLVNNIL